MNAKLPLIIPLLALIATSAGCGGAAAPPVSDVKLKAVELNRRGEKAVSTADYQKALVLYGEALRLNRGIDDHDGVGVNLINLASVHTAMGNADSALPLLDEILDSKVYRFGPETSAHALLLKGSLTARKGDDRQGLADAITLLDRALSTCGECTHAGAIYNQKALLTLRRGRANVNDETPAPRRETGERIREAREFIMEARALADKALAINRAASDRVNEADSLRISAAAAAAMGRYADAKQLYAEALALDKSLGKGFRVVDDLIGLAKVAIKEVSANDGSKTEAERFLLRAKQAAKAAGDNAGEKEADALLKEFFTPK
jgi:tetratricopeptide (TPR) repeat protein